MRKSGSMSNNESVQYPFEEHAESKFTTHSLDEVVTMVHCIISLYESKVLFAPNKYSVGMCMFDDEGIYSNLHLLVIRKRKD